MKLIWLTIILLLGGWAANGQNPRKALRGVGQEPIFFIDSVRVSNDQILKYSPEEIASISIYKDSSAIKLMGQSGQDGVIYAETKAFASIRFKRYFSGKSKEFARLIQSTESNVRIQYVLNDKILTQNFEGELAGIDDSVFKGISIINSPELEREFKVKDKDFGVKIITDDPKRMKGAKKKS